MKDESVKLPFSERFQISTSIHRHEINYSEQDGESHICMTIYAHIIIFNSDGHCQSNRKQGGTVKPYAKIEGLPFPFLRYSQRIFRIERLNQRLCSGLTSSVPRDEIIYFPLEAIGAEFGSLEIPEIRNTEEYVSLDLTPQEFLVNIYAQNNACYCNAYNLRAWAIIY